MVVCVTPYLETTLFSKYVPLEWVGALLAVGGNWVLDEPMTDELKGRIASAHDATKSRMKKWAIENDVVIE